jgi:serine protease Do
VWLSLLLASTARADSLATLVDRLRPAVVNVQAEQGTRHELDDFFDRFFGNSGNHRRALGSGFVFDGSGYIVTNLHVVKDASDVRVKLSDEREFEGDVVGRDPKTDLALVKLRGAHDLPTVQLGDSDRLRVGDRVMAIGNPFGLGNTVTSGIVSAKERVVGAGPYDDFIQTDASINPGNSGGPLFDLDGQVVGVNTAILAGGQGIGFAIPVNLVKVVVEQLRARGHVTRGFIGLTVQDLSPELARAFHLPHVNGALTAEIQADGPAAHAGLLPGDVIVEWNGRPVAQSNRLPLLVAETPPGTKAHVVALRDGHRLTADVVVAELPPADEDRPPAAPAHKIHQGLGVELHTLPADIARRHNLPNGATVVTSVDPDGAAAGQLVPGDVVLEVDHVMVRDAEDARRRMSSSKGTILLRVRHKESYIFVALHA